ncbi:MAG TPA: 5'/3'-nucleotidase SurE [Candidatus Dormibacteraeota bacterium]|nr:5'/3'-nucleotidase SurE [Candidatus Dormibacteraeota bacterium]
MQRFRSTVMLAAILVAATAGSASAQNLKVLVTNDDGVAAAGIDVLVTTLAANANLDVTVIAPAVNSSGTGENRTTTTIGVFAGTTASGFPATVVNGFPGDTTLFGILQQMQSDPPDLVVSGVNNGQNLSAEIIPLSGTVGAATWAARLGIPAFAVSAGLGASPNYTQAAQYAAGLVEYFRVKKGFRKKMHEKDAPFRGLVLNINFPTCTAGSVRGVRVVPVGRAQAFTAYTLQGSSGGVDTWKPTIVSGNPFISDCTSTVEDVGSDLAAFNVGFATVTPLDPERNSTGRRVKDFKFAAKLF